MNGCLYRLIEEIRDWQGTSDVVSRTATLALICIRGATDTTTVPLGLAKTQWRFSFRGLWPPRQRPMYNPECLITYTLVREA